MSRKQKILVAVTALAAFVASCGQPESADQTWPDDEYALVKRNQQEALESGELPIDQAMAEFAAKDRSEFVVVEAQPSEDLSALSGWSFYGAVPIAPDEVKMPAECESAPNPEACWGQKLYSAKGCIACHAIDGERQQPCPNWKGLYGKERLLTTGETVIADDAYIAHSITNSWDQIVQGYGKTMPPYNFPEQEVQALVAYVKSLGGGS